MNGVTFTIPGEAVSFGTVNTRFIRNGKVIGGTRKTTRAKDWEAEVRRVAAEAWGDRPLLEGPVSVEILCVFSLSRSKYRKRTPRPAEWKITKPDADKIDRLIMDALAGVVYVRDQQVAVHRVAKITGAQGQAARTKITVRSLQPLPEGWAAPGMDALSG